MIRAYVFTEFPTRKGVFAQYRVVAFDVNTWEPVGNAIIFENETAALQYKSDYYA
jgi:hypothetical protein